MVFRSNSMGLEPTAFPCHIGGERATIAPTVLIGVSKIVFGLYSGNIKSFQFLYESA